MFVTGQSSGNPLQSPRTVTMSLRAAQRSRSCFCMAAAIMQRGFRLFLPPTSEDRFPAPGGYVPIPFRPST